MSAEDRWADRAEWARDRGEVEVKLESKLSAGYECVARGCEAPAVKEYEIGLVDRSGSGVPVDLCVDHDDVDLAFEIYHRLTQGA